MTRNIPNNRLEEAQIASQLSNIVSHKTQLSLLSVIDSPDDELELIEKENGQNEDRLMNQYFGKDEGASDVQE